MDKILFSIIKGIFEFLITIILFMTGYFSWLWKISVILFFNYWLQITCYIFLDFLRTTIIDSFFEYYRNFIIEEKYEFNKMTKKLFILDTVK